MSPSPGPFSSHTSPLIFAPDMLIAKVLPAPTDAPSIPVSELGFAGAEPRSSPDMPVPSPNGPDWIVATLEFPHLIWDVPEEHLI